MRWIWLLAVAAGLCGLTVGTVPQVAAQGTFESSAELELHKLVCPADTIELFENCHEDRLGGVMFNVGTGFPVTDDEGVFTGTIAFTGTSTTVTIIEDPMVAILYYGAYLYCRDLNTDTVLIDGRLETNAADIVVTDGQTIVCDWYDLNPPIGGADTGETESGGPVATTDVSGLPATGSGTARVTHHELPWLLSVLALGLASAALGFRRRRAAKR
jgi:hypothetical protein